MELTDELVANADKVSIYRESIHHTETVVIAHNGKRSRLAVRRAALRLRNWPSVRHWQSESVGVILVLHGVQYEFGVW